MPASQGTQGPPSLIRGLSGILGQPDTSRNEYEFDRFNRKTKITCTLGPSSNSVENIVKLLQSGMNVARLNFSHGDHKSHLQTLNNVREAMKISGRSCACMLDTKGPEIRTGLLKDGKNIVLKAGQKLEIHCSADMETFLGDEEKICLDYKNLPNIVSEGSLVKIDDGLIVCKVVSVDPAKGVVFVTLNNTAELGQKKGVNLPGAHVDLPVVTQRDVADIGFAVANKMDLIAASFTRNAECVHEIRRLLGEEGKLIQIICKIENQQGLDHFDSILEAADGIMVARGDLGVEIPIQKVCLAQKMMIRKCNLAGKPVITATQMLESMVENPRPTRAEATDVANAVFDGSDCVMLSGETAKGKYPFEAAFTMARICRSAEAAMDHVAAFQTMVQFTKAPLSRSESITSAAVKCAMDLDVGCIVVLTETGLTGRLVAKYRPSMPVISITPIEKVARHGKYVRGLWPLWVDDVWNEEILTARAVEFARVRGWLPQEAGKGQIVLVSGLSKTGTTNAMKVLDV